MHLGTTKCCRELTMKDMVGATMDMKTALGFYHSSLYGGNAHRFCRLRCDCGKEYIGWLKRESGGYRILTLSIPKPEQDPDDPTKRIGTEDETYVCDICGKEAKSKSGLSSHMRTQ